MIGLCKCRKSQTAISEFRGQKINAKENKKKRLSTDLPELRSAQVLLLLIQHGANGLNLLEAQHVVLVEPLLNPAAEAQAISRVHRIGQENKTFVHRFIVCTISSFTVILEISPDHRFNNTQQTPACIILCIYQSFITQQTPVHQI